MAPVTLDARTRARVAARVALTSALRGLPDATVSGIRTRHFRRPTPWTARAVALLRHRSIASLGSFELQDRPGVRLAAVDNQIAKLLYWYGEAGYEPDETAVWRELCAGANRIVEVGANVGYYTVQGSKAAPTTPYTAVEAHPDSAAVLRRNVALNGLCPVTVVQAAALGGPVPESVDLALPDQERYAAPTGAFLAAGAEGVPGRRAASRRIRVPAVDAAPLVSGADLLKLDIEGAEHLVLDSVLPELLDSGTTVLVEVLRETPKLRAQLDRLMAAGHRAAVVTSDGVIPIDRDHLAHADLTREYGSRDVVLARSDRMPRAGTRNRPR